MLFRNFEVRNNGARFIIRRLHIKQIVQVAFCPGIDHVIIKFTSGIARLAARIYPMPFRRFAQFDYHSPRWAIGFAECVYGAFGTTNHQYL